MGTELVGECLSRGTNQLGTHCGGPNVRGPYGFGTKCVTAHRSIIVRYAVAFLLLELKIRFLRFVQKVFMSIFYLKINLILQKDHFYF